MALPPDAQPNDWTFQRVVWATLVLVLVALGFWLLYRFYQVVFILFIAIVIGTAIRPAVAWLNQRGLSKVSGVFVVYFLLLILLAGFLFLLFPVIVKQGATITAEVPGYYQDLRDWMGNNPNQLIARLGNFLPVALTGLNQVQQTGQQVMASASQVLGYISLAAEVIFFIIVILVLAFYWAIDGPRTIKTFLLLVPQGRRESISELISSMETKLGFYIAGQGILCLVIGVMSLIAYLLIGLPNALVLALLAGALEAVPMVGPLLGAIPAGLVALSIGPSKLIWVIVSTVIIQQLENSLLVPRVMRKAVGVNPFVSLLSIFAFGSLFGIAGALMAIPIAAIVQLLLDHFVFHPMTADTQLPIGRDSASRLRYEAQDLAQDLRKQARHRRSGSVLKGKQIDQVMDEIETITTDLDSMLAQISNTDAP